MKNPKIGELVGFDAAANTHGCCDYAVGKIISVVPGKVTLEITEAESCGSCWQVGHDADHLFYSVGQKVVIEKRDLSIASEGWSREVRYVVQSL